MTDEESFAVTPLWHVGGGKAFVDFQNDVTANDVVLAEREGFRSVEHLKRYTTLGMATDQGKLSNVNGLAIMAALTGPDDTGDWNDQLPAAAGPSHDRRFSWASSRQAVSPNAVNALAPMGAAAQRHLCRSRTMATRAIFSERRRKWLA